MAKALDKDTLRIWNFNNNKSHMACRLWI